MIKIHVSEKREGKYGPFYVLHQVEDDDEPIIDDYEQYVSCIVSAKAMKDTSIEYGYINKIVMRPEKCKWKESEYGVQLRTPPMTKEERADLVNSVLLEITNYQKQIITNQSKIDQKLDKLDDLMHDE